MDSGVRYPPLPLFVPQSVESVREKVGEYGGSLSFAELERHFPPKGKDDTVTREEWRIALLAATGSDAEATSVLKFLTKRRKEVVLPSRRCNRLWVQKDGKWEAEEDSSKMMSLFDAVLYSDTPGSADYEAEAVLCSKKFYMKEEGSKKITGVLGEDGKVNVRIGKEWEKVDFDPSFQRVFYGAACSLPV